MICQYCGKKTATTHMKQTINGKTTEWHVCAECASKQGIGLSEAFGLDVGNLFGGLFTQPLLRDPDEGTRCTICRKSFREIVQSGKVGCPDCYIQFYDRLQPSIQRIHGKTTHIGKVAASGGKESVVARELENLKAELSKAIAQQEYERCAELRDRIKELEEEYHG